MSTIKDRVGLQPLCSSASSMCKSFCFGITDSFTAKNNKTALVSTTKQNFVGFFRLIGTVAFDPCEQGGGTHYMYANAQNRYPLV